MCIKRKVLAALVAVIAGHLAASSTLASIVAPKVGALIKLYDGPGNGNGGEFKVNVKNPGASGFTNDSFRTFCVEISEHISFGTTYKVKSITNKTDQSGKTLTARTAALFQGFIDGLGSTGVTKILGIDYRRNSVSHQNADGRSLQLAIWKSMGWDSEAIWTTGGYKNEFQNNSKANLWYNAILPPDSSSYSRVGIMNLSDSNGNGNYQDQLVIVPEPFSIVIWGLVALGSMGSLCFRRRVGA